MIEIIQQFINQIEQDQKLSLNTKSAYKSDLNDLIGYIKSTNTQIQDIAQSWVKSYLKHLEETNKERNSYNRRASTFRIFLRFLYRNKLTQANYSLIVNNQTTFNKSQEEALSTNDIKKIIEDTKLKIDQRLILILISRLRLTATQIVSLRLHQIDFESKAINLTDTEKINLPLDIFILLREYLLDCRTSLENASNSLNLFLNEKEEPITEIEIYKLIKKLGEDLSMEGKLTTRSLKKSMENKTDILSMQKEIYSVISPT